MKTSTYINNETNWVCKSCKKEIDPSKDEFLDLYRDEHDCCNNCFYDGYNGAGTCTKNEVLFTNDEQGQCDMCRDLSSAVKQ